MASLTKTVDGNPLPAEDFAYVGDPKDPSTWHLPIDKNNIGAAVKMFGHEKHVPESAKAATARKIADRAKAAGIDTKDFEDKYCHAERNDGWIEVFRAGDYRKQGKALVTRSDLERVVRNYDPAQHEAPVCVGHPKNDAPAYAWVERLALDGDTLLMKEHQVDPQFNEARRAGRYKKRSAAFYPDEQGRAAALRHVAFLGAEPPAVKGLKDVSFDDAGRPVIEVEFGEEETVDNDKQIESGVKEWFKKTMPFLFSEGSAPAAGVAFSEAQVKQIASEAAVAAAKPLQDEVAALKTQLADQKTKFSEIEQRSATAETQQRATAAVAKLKSSGHWIPAFDKTGITQLFSELAKDSTVLEFGEGDAKKKQTGLEILVEFMEALPKIVPGGRVVNPGSARAAGKTTGDPLTDMAKARATEKKLSFGEALAEVAAENPELAAPGGVSAAGTV